MQFLRRILFGFVEKVHWILFPLRESEELIERATVANLKKLRTRGEIACGDFTAHYLLPYREPLVQACMLEAKFHHSARAYELLGTLLGGFLQAFAREHPEVGIVLIPVPLGPRRRTERGYNQVEEIAQAALQKLRGTGYAEQFKLAPHLLTRTRDTSPQMELGRAERLTNMTGAFACSLSSGAAMSDSEAKLPIHLIYVVLDDVLTTGATITSAAALLRDAGATKIFCISLAH